MARYLARFTPGSGPKGNLIEVEAAMFKAEGEFVGFCSRARRNMGDYNNPSGDIVRRIRTDFVLESVEPTEQ